MEETLTTLDPPVAASKGRHAWMPLITPMTLTSISRRVRASGISSSAPTAMTAALLINACSRPPGTAERETTGARRIPADQPDPNPAQTPGMTREAAINKARVGAQKIWAGTVHIEANAKTGPHHHGPLESVIYVVRGRARMRWGERLEYIAE